MSDDIETAAAATPRAVLERHILDVNVPKSETEWWAHHEIVALRKALYDRHAADKKAWSAIMRATGKERGLPDNKEVVAFYVAEVERLEKELATANQALAERWNEIAFRNMQVCVEATERSRDSLRAKLERAKEALKEAIDEYEDNSHYKSEFLQEKHGDVAEIARLRAIYAELSADAPAQQTQISDEVRHGSN